VARSTNTKSFPSFIEASEKIRTSIILAPARPDGTVFVGTLVELGAVWYDPALDSPELYYTAWYNRALDSPRLCYTAPICGSEPYDRLAAGFGTSGLPKPFDAESPRTGVNLGGFGAKPLVMRPARSARVVGNGRNGGSPSPDEIEYDENHDTGASGRDREHRSL
jgi:hypothetical protein